MRSKSFRDLVEQVIHAIDSELHETDYQYGSDSLRAMIARIARGECRDYLDEQITEQARVIARQEAAITRLSEKIEARTQIHHLDWDGSVPPKAEWDSGPDAHRSRFTD